MEPVRLRTSEGAGSIWDGLDLDQLLLPGLPELAFDASSSPIDLHSLDHVPLYVATTWSQVAAIAPRSPSFSPAVTRTTSSEGAGFEFGGLGQQVFSDDHGLPELAIDAPSSPNLSASASVIFSDAPTTIETTNSITMASEVAMGGSDLDELPYSENPRLQVANIASSPHNLFASPSTFPSDAQTNISVPPTTSAEGADLELDAMEQVHSGDNPTLASLFARFASKTPCFSTSPSTFLSDISSLDQRRIIMASEGVMVEFRDRMWTQYTAIALDYLSYGDPCFVPSTDSFITSPSILPSDAETTTASASPSGANTSGIGTRWESTSIRDWERVKQELTYLRETQRDNDVLVQVWVPTRCGDGLFVLTMTGQPFTVDQSSDNLLQFKEVPPHYPVSADFEAPNSRYSPSPARRPSRAFIGRLRSRDGRPFIRYEWDLGVGGTLGLPMFDRMDPMLGVIELVRFKDEISFVLELDTICSALQAIKLTATHVSSIPRTKFNGASYIDALPEILQVLKAACILHELPLAQTWVTCALQAKRDGHNHSDENYRYCISTIDAACYVNDPRMHFFHKACSEHHLLPGQGVAGKAFATNQPCFLTDVGSSSEQEYPLSHHAKIFKLKGVMAIRLRSKRTGTADFVLEFFLPIDCEVESEQKRVLNFLSVTMKTLFQTLRMVGDKEMEEDPVWEMNELNSISLQKNKKAKRRKPMEPRSAVWKNFTKVMVGDNIKAKCDYCGNNFCCDSKNGTTSLKAHLKRCKFNPNRTTGPI